MHRGRDRRGERHWPRHRGRAGAPRRRRRDRRHPRGSPRGDRRGNRIVGTARACGVLRRDARRRCRRTGSPGVRHIRPRRRADEQRRHCRARASTPGRDERVGAHPAGQCARSRSRRTGVRTGDGPARGGYVVNTASIAGVWAYSWDSAPYITSKFAAYGFSEALARSLRPLGIGVSVLCPVSYTRISGRRRGSRACLTSSPGNGRTSRPT